MISYYLEAIFATIYFLVLLAIRTQLLSHLSNRSPALQRVLGAFEKTVETFLYASVIFAISMLAAGIARYVQYKFHPEHHESVYALLSSVYMSAFSIFPTLILQCVHERQHRRQWLPLLLWFIVICCAVTIDVLYRTTSSREHWDVPEDLDTAITGFSDTGSSDDLRIETQYVEGLWLGICDPQDLRLKLTNILTVSHILLGLNVLWWLYTLLSSLFQRRSLRHPRLSNNFPDRYYCISLVSWWRIRKSWLKPLLLWLNAGACLALMWTTLAYFHVYRNVVSGVAGDSDKDGEWTFGQVLALATWAPVLVDLTTSRWFHPFFTVNQSLQKNMNANLWSYADIHSSSSTDIGQPEEREVEYGPSQQKTLSQPMTSVGPIAPPAGYDSTMYHGIFQLEPIQYGMPSQQVGSPGNLYHN